MPRVIGAQSKYKSIVVNDFSGALKDTPRLEKEFEIFQNVYIRKDGYIVSRGQIVTMTPNFGAFGSNTPRGIWLVNTTIGFQYVVAHTGNWVGVNITAQGPPPSATLTTLKAYSEGTRPTLVQGIDKNGNPAVFFCGFDGSSTNVFQYSAGAAVTLTAWTNQLMLGFRDNVLFGGGGQSGALSNKIFYSTPGDPTTQPAANVTFVTGPGGGIPLDMLVVNDAPVIILSTGLSATTGGTSQGFLPVERSGFNDNVMARTLASNGTNVYFMGNHGLYAIEQIIKEISQPVRGWWYVNQTGAALLPPSFGRGSFSSNGMFFGVILNNSTLGSSFVVNSFTYDNALLIYDLRLKNWQIFTLPSTFAPFFIAPGGPDLLWGGTPGGTFSSFAVLGKDITNTLTKLVFVQLADGDTVNFQDNFP